MPIVKGNLTRKFYDARPNRATSALSSSIMTAGVMSAVSFGEPHSVYGQDTYGVRPYVYGMERDDTQGSPNSPCIRLDYPVSMFRFRWVVKPGQRRVSVRVKQQIHNFPSQLPTMIIKSNSNVGVPTDIITTAPSTNDWTLIGPVVLTITGTDVLFVEIWNNLLLSNTPLFIDRIVAT